MNAVVSGAVIHAADDLVVSGVLTVTIERREGRLLLGAAVRGEGGRLLAEFPPADVTDAASVTFAGIEVFAFARDRSESS